MKDIRANHDLRITRRSVLCAAVTTAAAVITSRVLAEEMQKYLPPRMQPNPRGRWCFLIMTKKRLI